MPGTPEDSGDAPTPLAQVPNTTSGPPGTYPREVSSGGSVIPATVSQECSTGTPVALTQLAQRSAGEVAGRAHPPLPLEPADRGAELMRAHRNDAFFQLGSPPATPLAETPSLSQLASPLPSPPPRPRVICTPGTPVATSTSAEDVITCPFRGCPEAARPTSIAAMVGHVCAKHITAG